MFPPCLVMHSCNVLKLKNVLVGVLMDEAVLMEDLQSSSTQRLPAVTDPLGLYAGLLGVPERSASTKSSSWIDASCFCGAVCGKTTVYLAFMAFLNILWSSIICLI